MRNQKHLIKRQIIELNVPSTTEAHRLQAEASRIYRQRLIPLIDQSCTALSDPDQIHRIELLELDLGYVDPAHLEEDLVAKLSVALPKALADQIDEQARRTGQQGQSSKVMSQLELFGCFARTGSLPWWADVTQPQLLDDCLQWLLDAAPESLRRLMHILVREQQPLQRLISHYADAHLADLAKLLLPVFKRPFLSDLLALLNILPKMTTASARPSAQLRRSLWLSFLQLAGLHAGSDVTPEDFYEMVLRRLSVDFAVTNDELIADIHQVLQTGRVQIDDQLQDLLETFYREYLGDELADIAVITRHLTRLQAAGGPLTRLWSVLRTLVPRLATSSQNQLLDCLTKLKANHRSDPALQLDLIRRIVELLPSSPSELEKLATSTGLSPADLSELTRLRHQLLNEPQHGLTPVDETSPLLLPANAPFIKLVRQTGTFSEAEDENHSVSLEPTPSLPDFIFSDPDELYIGNAGLVILWPFLSHFFAHLGLLTDKTLMDTAARQRAVGLLQYIATEDPAPPEYLLPLNKALCGLELTEVFDFGPPLTEAEADGCADLLRAVIAQAPILRDMSTAGFRGSFLLRQGILRTRDGAWLLQVERETYDVVLDRFPWRWEWLKLPWMAAPLRVEW